MDTSQYLEIFLDESKDHLQTLSDQLMNLEDEPENMETINEIFRAAHSLKGMAGTMGYKKMQELTHHTEDVFSEIRNGAFKVNESMIDILFKALDQLEKYVDNIQKTSDEGIEECSNIITALEDILANKGIVSSQQTQSDSLENLEIEITDVDIPILLNAKKEGLNTINISVSIQDSCLLKAARAFMVFQALGENGDIIKSNPSSQDIEDENFKNSFKVLYITKLTLEEVKNLVLNVSEIESCEIEKITNDFEDFAQNNQALEENKDTKQKESVKNSESKDQKSDKKPQKAVTARTVRVDIEKLDALMNLVSELIIAKNSLVSTAHIEGVINNTNLNEPIEYLESVTTNLHESVMKVRMVPIESVVQKFPKMIRDLSKKLGKKMDLHMSGEETELDRTVVDEIGDPLMHLLRNSADHGLEENEERIKRGKPEHGQIYLDAYQDGNNVVIEVRDDGNGIDIEAVKQKAIDKGIISIDQGNSMEDKEIINLLFMPSFSTAKEVTDISGRGVGLDVVKSKIEALSGDIEVKSKLGEGSSFIIRLPLTLAIIQALMVVIGEEKYAIPLNSIQTIEDINPSEIKYVDNKEVINLRGNIIPLIKLNNILSCNSQKSEDENMIVCIVKKGDKLLGLVVDSLIGQQEIVIKPLGKFINKNKIISGATILGDGEIALIIDVNSLV